MSIQATNNLFIVAMGASAGGLQAMINFFSNFPSAGGVAFIINQHFPREGTSFLSNLLHKHTPFEVTEAKEGETIIEGKVYTVPGWAEMELDQQTIILRERKLGPNQTINTLFISVGKQIGPKGIGVIFSGTGTDGLLGVKAIEANNGIVLVQEPKTAHFDGLPNTIITSDHPDHILAPSDMSAYILGHIQTRIEL